MSALRVPRDPPLRDLALKQQTARLVGGCARVFSASQPLLTNYVRSLCVHFAPPTPSLLPLLRRTRHKSKHSSVSLISYGDTPFYCHIINRQLLTSLHAPHRTARLGYAKFSLYERALQIFVSLPATTETCKCTTSSMSIMLSITHIIFFTLYLGPFFFLIFNHRKCAIEAF